MNQAEPFVQDALRRFLRSGQEDASRLLPGLLARAAETLAPGHEHDPQHAARAGECLHLLAALLRGQRDTALAARLLQALAAAGRLGRALVSLHLQSRFMPLAQCTPLLLVLPEQDFLALLNDMLLDCPADDKQFALWLKSLLPAPARLDQREALLFLKSLAPPHAADGLPLARPLRQALLAAGLGEAMARALAGNPGAATLEALLLAAEPLDAPEVQSETLAHALRFAGAEGPSRLGPLLLAPQDLPPRENALLLELRRLALLPEAPMRLHRAAYAEPELLGLVLADLLMSGGRPGATALQLLPLLPGRGVAACLQALPPHVHPPLRARLLQALAELEPEFLRRAAKVLGRDLDEASARVLAGLLARRPGEAAGQGGDDSPWNTAAWDTAAWADAPRPLGPAQPLPKAAQQRRETLAEAVQDAILPLKDRDLSHSQLADKDIEGLSFSASDLSCSAFSGLGFRRVRFSSTLLAQSRFENCRFTACAFQNTDLSHASFNNCRFEGCSFDCCDLSRARFTACHLAACSLAESSLAGCALLRTRLSGSTLRTCSLAGAQLSECSLRNLSLTRCDLSCCLWLKSACRDAELTACSLGHMRVLGCECLELRLTRCGCAGLTVLGGHSDNPQLCRAGRGARMRRMEAATLPALAPGQAAVLAEGPGGAFAKACVESFLRVDEARRSLTVMRARDQRRRELALERLGEGQGQFLLLLPTLLATSVFEKAQGLEGVPPCALGGHARPEALPRGVRAQLERLFPGQAMPQQNAPAGEPPLLLEAVYLIGSVGSVAQKPSSDLDCWVCARPRADASPGEAEAARAGLTRKLAALEVWAGQQFGLEAHFFLMGMEQVRRNDFGISDKESSGSAQAALLKEEFYRTALKLAGQDLLWWAAPAGAGQEQAGALLAELAALDPRTAAELTDLGQPRPIPPEEFFGACLWQIVKGLNSPYKSVMKLGLLEKYAGQGSEAPLLCDRIKEAVLRGARRTRDVDPYLSLFAALRDHYRAKGDAASLALVGECLRLKAQVEPEDLPEGLEAAPLPNPNQQGEDHEDAGDFAGALRLGGMVNAFMISAYRRIQEGIHAEGGSARISPQDLTRLGRRIAANFAQHPDKLGLVPFLADELVLTELFFYAEKVPGRRTVWAVKGKDRSAGKAPVETQPTIRRDTDMVRLLAWLLFNGLYDPRQMIQAERSLAPIGLADLQQLLAELAAFFPRRATLEPDLDEYLKDERVARAFLIANLPVPPDKNRIHSVSVLSASNWGEVFCQTFENPPLTLQKSALDFLRATLSRPVPLDTPLRAFTPKRSACPKIRLS